MIWSPESVGRIDDLRAAHLVLEVGDLRLDLALAFLGGVVFGVLRQIAVRARFLDRFDDLGTLARAALSARRSAFHSLPPASAPSRYSPFLFILRAARSKRAPPPFRMIRTDRQIPQCRENTTFSYNSPAVIALQVRARLEPSLSPSATAATRSPWCKYGTFAVERRRADRLAVLVALPALGGVEDQWRHRRRRSCRRCAGGLRQPCLPARPERPRRQGRSAVPPVAITLKPSAIS